MATATSASINSTIKLVDPICPDRDWYTEMGKQVAYIVYYIVTPIYFILGILCHCLSLTAFFKQCRKEKAYVYQVFITGCKLVEVTFTFLYAILLQWWASALRPGPAWYRSCYACMFWSAHFSLPVQNVFLTVSQLFLVFMCADRVYALWRPFAYKSSNQRRNFVGALCFCVVLGISVNGFSFLRFYVNPTSARTDDGRVVYELASDAVLLASLASNVLTQMRNVVWSSCLVLLYVLNGVLIYFYRTKVRQAKNLLGATAAVTMAISTSEKRKQEAERTLILIAVFQSIFNTCSMTAFLLYSYAVFLNPMFYYCKGALYAPLTDAGFQISDLLGFVGVFCVSRQFRSMIKKTFSCVRGAGSGSGTVAPGGGVGGGGGQGGTVVVMGQLG